jgi:hypothetical protein
MTEEELNVAADRIVEALQLVYAQVSPIGDVATGWLEILDKNAKAKIVIRGLIFRMIDDYNNYGEMSMNTLNMWNSAIGNVEVLKVLRP